MNLNTQFIMTFFLGVFFGLTILAFIQKILVKVIFKAFSKILSEKQKNEITEPLIKSFKEKIKEKMNEDEIQIGIITDDEDEFHNWIAKNNKINESYIQINNDTDLFGLEFHRIIKIKGHENIQKIKIQKAQNRIKRK